MQRYVLLKNQVYRWEEKEPFAQSGALSSGRLNTTARETPSSAMNAARGSGAYRPPTYTGFIKSVPRNTKGGTTCVFVPLCAHQPTLTSFQREPGDCARPADSRPVSRQARGITGITLPTALRRPENQRNVCREQTILCIQKIAADLDRTPACAEVRQAV